MDDKILISVIVPAYNAETWLPACLDSILNQTYKHLEVIVIDDGSNDGTGDILDEYARKDSRIIAVHQKNAGLVAGREKGISIAKGKYVAFVDADDTIKSDRYERLLWNAVKYEADISHCGMAFIFSDHTEPHYGTGEIIILDNEGGQRELLKGEKFEPSLCNKLYRREIMVDSCLDTTIINNEDLLRNFVLFKRASKSIFEDFCGYCYYQRTGTMSKEKNKEIQISKNVIRARRLIVENSEAKIYPYAMRSWLNAIVNTINQFAFSKDKEKIKYASECGAVLKRERRNLHFLIKRQQLAAKLYLVSPWLHQIIYKFYQKKRV